ncbi:hypothetical protein ACIBHY_39355 [Nonomuraea sp. NPDC050547]|uniref:hypothetical protein n=1 Tax=unclassified Nonomuraea TaxID=2593643 RepID=UPI003791DC61
MDEPAGSATGQAPEYSLAEQDDRWRRLTCSHLHDRDARFRLAEVEALVKLWKPWAAGQTVLFVQGYGMVSPQGRLLAREQM